MSWCANRALSHAAQNHIEFIGRGLLGNPLDGILGLLEDPDIGVFHLLGEVFKHTDAMVVRGDQGAPGAGVLPNAGAREMHKLDQITLGDVREVGLGEITDAVQFVGKILVADKQPRCMQKLDQRRGLAYFNIRVITGAQYVVLNHSRIPTLYL